jgi:hypothetical protein
MRLKTLAEQLIHPRRLASMLTKPVDELTRLANRFGTDKGSLAGGHHYTRVYSELFESRRQRPIRLLEIGLLGLEQGGWDNEALRDRGTARGSDAPSLRMWSSYFPHGQIFGLDFNDFSAVAIERCQIFKADAGKPSELLKVAEQIAGEVDIVIDDASHTSHEQQIALGTLFPFVAPGGLYIIEDLFFQPPDREHADATKTVDVLRRAEATGKFEAPHLPRENAAYLDQHVERVSLFDSLSGEGPLTTRDALGVIWKKRRDA